MTAAALLARTRSLHDHVKLLADQAGELRRDIRAAIWKDGVRDPNADVALAKERIQPSGHMSPFEHVAQAMTDEQWHDYGVDLMRDWIEQRIPPGNLWGWRQLRKTIENEHDFGRIAKVPR